MQCCKYYIIYKLFYRGWISKQGDHRKNTEADNYHYFSYDPKFGTSGKAYRDTICSEKKWKVGITEWLDYDDKDRSRLEASFVSNFLYNQLFNKGKECNMQVTQTIKMISV